MTDSSRWVWVPDETKLFVKGLVVGENDNNYEVRVKETGETKVVSASQVEKVNPAQFHKVGDMAELTYLNEPSVIDNLSARWADGSIYTYSGLFLVAVNPYRPLNIYGDDAVAQFKGKRRDESEPHIYAVAEQAFRSMLESKREQSILITGESGAGKTENTKKAIQYLSSITNSGTNVGNAHGIDARILQTNPILESFGNAQTIRNSNSSRFGKFIKIQFARESNAITGASIQWYLLEKSRVVSQLSNERNYHIFYQLLRGAPADLRAKLELPDDTEPAHFKYLESGASKIDGVDDAQLYAQLVDAFRITGFSTRDVEEIMKMVASVLMLGQISFRATSADQGSVVDMTVVERVSRLLGLSASDFINSILQPRVKIRGEQTKQSRNARQAQHTTNAVAKALYERLFGYIVEQLNSRLGKENHSGCSIGVLDIAGFEIFEKNSFEQLCINYTNEKLQQFFNHHMFVLEQQEYVRENVDWDYVDYGSDLQPTIDLIEQAKNPMGIFSCLNEESVLPSASDESFNEKLVQQWQDKNAKFKPSRLGTGFMIDHYAQSVEYQTDGWLEKNKDPLSDAVESVLAESSNELVRQLFANNETSKLKGKANLFRTVAQRHKEQLSSLMLHLEATHPHFVRCIIPNTERSPAIFDNHLVLDQLRYNGVLEGIRIARSGFPNRLGFAEFCQRYRALAGGSVSGPLDSQQTCITILQKIDLDPTGYKVGLSKVFFRNGVLAKLEHRLDELLAEQALAVQSFIRGALVRMEVKRLLHRRRAAKMYAACFKLNNQYANDAWWQFHSGLKPLLLSREHMDNSKKDLRMQKMESTLHRLKEEQVELMSSKNELRAELIEALRAKEELADSLAAATREQKELVEVHESAMANARKRDEASTDAIRQLSERHGVLWSELEKTKAENAELTNNHEANAKEKLQDLQVQLSKEQELRHAAEIERDAAKAESERLSTNVSEETAKLTAELNELRATHRETQSKLKQSATEHADAVKTKDDKIVALEAQLGESQALVETSKQQHEAEISKTKAELADVHQKHAELKRVHETKVAALNTTNTEFSEAKGKLEETTQELSRLREWLSKAKVELKAAAQTHKELTDLQETHKNFVEKSKETHSGLTEKHAIVQKQLADLQKEHSNSVASDELTKLQKENQRLSRDIDISTENLLKISDELAEYKSKVDILEKDLDSKKKELKELNTSFRELKSNQTDVQAELATANTALNKLKDEAAGLKQQLEAKEKALTEANLSLNKNNSEVTKLKQELETAASKVKDAETKISLNSATLLKAQTQAKEHSESLAKLSADKSSIVSQLTKEKENVAAELKQAQTKLTELNGLLTSRRISDSGSVSANFDTARKLASTRKELADTQKALMRAQTQAQSAPSAPVSPYSKRFNNSSDLEQELAEAKHDLAQANAQFKELEAELESARKENAQAIILRQKYEKLQREKAHLAQDRSQLMLNTQNNRTQSQELEIAKARASEVKRLQSEVNILKLELARSTRGNKTAESDKLAKKGSNSSLDTGDSNVDSLIHRLRLAEIAKLQLSKAVHELSQSRSAGIAIDSPESSPEDFGDGFDTRNQSRVNRKRDVTTALRNISNDRRVSDTHLVADQLKSVDLEEALEVYKKRASDFHSKLEKAEVIVESAIRAEKAAKQKAEEYKTRLEHIDDDHNLELAGLRREMLKSRVEIEMRDARIEDLTIKANFSADLQGQIRNMNSTLKDLSHERDRLAKDKAKLEKRLHDMVSSLDAQPKQLQEQILSMKKNEQQMIREQGELRWKLERKARLVDQLRRSLTDADARIEQCRAEMDRLQENDSAREMALRRANREITENNEKYLMAELELDQFRLSRRGTVASNTSNRNTAQRESQRDTSPAFV